jgi:hypothetical protein
MPGPTLDQALEGLTDEQKKMLVGLTPDEVIAARRGPIVTGKIADPSATTTYLPAYGAKGKADDATISMPTEDVGDYGPRTGPEPDAAPTSRPPTGPIAARVRKALGSAPAPSSTPSGSDPDAVEEPVDLSDKGQGIATSSAVPPPPPPPTRDVEMEKAMQESALRHKIGTIFQLFGIQPSGMDEPLERLAGQRQLQREHLADERQAQMYDPTSRPSRMAQAIAVKRFGWSPADAAQLTAADMPMVNQGFSAEETFKARKDAAAARKQESADRLAAEERMNKERIDERRFEAGQRAQDRALTREMGKPPDTKATGLLEGLDTLDQQLDSMPTDSDPFKMHRWAKSTNDLMAGAVGQGRLNAILMNNIKEALPGLTNMVGIGGDRQKVRDELKAFVARERSAVIRGQKAAGKNVSGFESEYGSQQQSQQPAPETRVIGGRKYVKQNGTWHEVVG